VPVACARVPEIGNSCGMHAGDLYADGRRVSHICATYINQANNIPENRQHRDNQHPTCRGVSTRMHRQPVPWPPIQFRALRGCQLRGCRFSIPPVAAPAESHPSRIPPESPPLAAASTCTSNPQSKKHISPGTLLVRSALSSRYLPSSMPALDSPKRARSCAFPRSTPKRPPAPSSSPSR